MNVLTKTISALIAGSLIASPVQAQSLYFNDHVALAEAVERVGVDFLLNPPECARNEKVYGWYHGYKRQLVVCQENASKFDYTEYGWTAEDLDTLRHEVHHMVQDCMDNTLDGRLKSVYEDPSGLAKTVLGYNKITKILNGYSDYSPHRQMMELEAFSVAALDDPKEQLKDIQNYCM